MAQPTIVVLGGGAAGFFGAIRAAELAPDARVILLEAGAEPLQKVRISGGGRCNVTHHPFEPALALSKYPRGAKELRGLLPRFGARETIAWFEAQGVALKVEPDGRVFPTTDDSETICACLMRVAKERGVDVRTHATVREAAPTGRGPGAEGRGPRVEGRGAGAEGHELTLVLKDGSTLDAAALLLATGSNPNGLALAKALGHTIVPPVPSLFTFNVRDARIDGLAGVSVEKVRARLEFDAPSALGPRPSAPGPRPSALEQDGPLLVTHWGLSAHAVLRLSAWGARELHAAGYRARLVVDFVPDVPHDALKQRFLTAREHDARSTLGARSAAPEVPRRLWERVVVAAGGDPATRWGDVPNRGVEKLVAELKRATFQVEGKGPFREEFVTAGGVARSEIDWRTMESKLQPGLFVAGEALDVDALTGGFNLQNAWSTGWIAGEGIAARLRAQTEVG